MTKSLTYPRDRQSASAHRCSRFAPACGLASAPAFGLASAPAPVAALADASAHTKVGRKAMARRVPEVKPTSPAAAIVLVLLFIVCFIIGLWVLMALTRIVLG